MFEAIINHENEQARVLDSAFNEYLLKAIQIRSDRAARLGELAHQRTQLGLIFMAGAFAIALFLTVITFTVLRRVVINPLQRAAKRIEHIAAGDLTVAEEVTGRSEIGRLTHDLQLMQHSWSKPLPLCVMARKKFIAGPARSLPGTPTFLHVLNSRLQRLSRPQPVWKSLQRP